mgnify:FL=1
MLTVLKRKKASDMEMTERKKKILAAVVERYILSGEPVGSKALVDLPGLSVSSATVRNDMADLVTAGYLEQPHTSAGRIPSSEGYRYYVDNLMGRYEPYSSLSGYYDDYVVNITIIALILIGGLGFTVWADIKHNKLHFKKYTLHTKMIAKYSNH